MFHFSSWLRKSYPGLFGTGKPANRKSTYGRRGSDAASGRGPVFCKPRLLTLEDRIVPAHPVVAVLGAPGVASWNTDV